jgi:hypothetical protein
MPSALLPLAALTVMLWIVWSDSVRSRKPGRILYALRVVTYLAVVGVLIFNLMAHPGHFTRAGVTTSILAAAAGVAGAWYFLLRAIHASGSSQ